MFRHFLLSASFLCPLNFQDCFRIMLPRTRHLTTMPFKNPEGSFKRSRQKQFQGDVEFNFSMLETQSTELIDVEGPLSYVVQHSAYRGSLHQR
jgi:hypothetical protein